MIHLDSISGAQAQARAWREEGSLGFVPTMGALHEGHLSLVKAARDRCARVVASIFVNPAQFGPGEDLERYPRTLPADSEKLLAAGCDAVFTTTPTEIYPPGYATWVSVEGSLSEALCGEDRPGHFRGVTTIVLKLLQIVSPTDAFFGQKDRQQLVLIQRMAADLHLPTEIHGCPIVREPDGLALSSRNAYLDPDQRLAALSLSRGLRVAQAAFLGGELDPRALEALVRRELERAKLEVGYASAVEPSDLSAAKAATSATILAIAASAGPTRLIDNCVLGQALPEPSGEQRA
ncbi:MAG: pantoate--beta-alanine ligase [Planctomycetes bacterium]|nr:pantoate--beta-alanine ligase [Planctomycetota bacterium]